MDKRYASYVDIPELPNKIITTLAKSNSEYAESVWKMLKYTGTDCLTKPNLTLSEKASLIWSPDKITSTVTQDSFNVFYKPLITSSLNTDVSQTQLRIYRYKNTPINQYTSTILMQIDLVVSELACMVRNPNNVMVEKTDLMEVYLLEVLQLLDVGMGFNFLRFDRLQNGNCSSILNINDSKAVFGRSFLLALGYTDMSNGGDCS